MFTVEGLRIRVDERVSSNMLRVKTSVVSVYVQCQCSLFFYQFQFFVFRVYVLGLKASCLRHGSSCLRYLYSTDE